MTFRERALAIMKHEKTDNIIFQPRIEHWYSANKENGTLPERYAEMSLLDVYDDLGCSLRTYDITYRCFNFVEDSSVKVETEKRGDVVYTRWITPFGSIESHVRVVPGWHVERFPVQTPEDMRVMEYILQGRQWKFDADIYDEGDAEIGDRGAPMLCIPRINLQRIIIEMMGFENTLYAITDGLEEMGRLINAIDDTDQQMLETVADSKFQIINFGDNLDQHFVSPPLFERYMLPVYKHRTDFLRKSGKYMHSHWDGSVKLLLKYAQDTGLDGIEALTPLPQGDTTIEEIKEALGEMVLLDGIPMTWFLPNEPLADLERVTHQVIETFSPNLILGVSDEVSPVCDIERVRRVSEIVKTYER